MITYEIPKNFDIKKIIEVFESSGIVRPTKEKERIKTRYWKNAHRKSERAYRRKGSINTTFSKFCYGLLS